MLINIIARPLKIRLGLRDHYEAEKSAPKAALAQLNEIVGFPYRLEVDWSNVVYILTSRTKC